MPVQAQRIQGFGNESFAEDQSHARAQDLTWDDILTMDILTAISTATQSALQAAGQMATDVSSDMERFKAAFSCQAPENATLSAERIAVEHAFTEFQTVFSCGAPDKSQLDADEVSCDGDESVDQVVAQQVELPAPTEKREPTADLLDLSDQPVVRENSVVLQSVAMPAVQEKDQDLSSASDNCAKQLEDLLELSDNDPAREKGLEHHPEQSPKQEECQASTVESQGRHEPLVTEAQQNHSSIDAVNLLDLGNPNPAFLGPPSGANEIRDLLDLS